MISDGSEIVDVLAVVDFFPLNQWPPLQKSAIIILSLSILKIIIF